MSLTSIWVVAEPGADSLTTTTLELLAPRGRLADEVRAITWGDGARFAAQAGDYGATHPLRRRRPGRRAAGCPGGRGASRPSSARGAPDAILIPASYDGRDIAGRLSARLDRPVLTNVTDAESTRAVS